MWVSPSPRNLAAPITSKFRRDLLSGTQQDIVNRKTALQTADTPAQANFIRCTLVHKRRKIGPEFWPTQRAANAIRLSTARI